jgi:hypothetical protein
MVVGQQSRQQNNRGSISGKDKWFSLFHSVQTGSGAIHPHEHRVPATSSLKVKLLEREGEYSAPSRVMEIYLHSPIRLYSVVLILCTGTTLLLPDLAIIQF